jgi:SpoVK/Ycf46/Vps4 family AAA+-type ATPase
MNLLISDLPDFSNEEDKQLFNSRISNAITATFKGKSKSEMFNFSVREQKSKTAKSASQNANSVEDTDAVAKLAVPVQEPKYTFDQIILDDDISEELRYAVKFETVRKMVYEDWNLQSIEPSPKLALNFWGDSGTGKTMAAHALTHLMGKKIIPASYAEIESKYHGDGPKNVKALFKYATENSAVLFIDEADSLLSRRLTNVTQGSEQAINSMRSQLLIEIENYTGVVIFATNLASNYDSAFITRIKSIHFKKPDAALRKRLWERMLIPALPIAEDVNTEQLAAIEDMCGREIKNAVVKAAIKASVNGVVPITHKDFEEAAQAIITSNKEIIQPAGTPLSEQEKKALSQNIRRAMRRGKHRRVRVD